MSSESLRVLLLVENAGAGSGRHVIDLAQGLLQRGHTVTLIYSESRLEEWFQQAVDDLAGLETHRVHMERNPGFHDLVSLAKIRSYMADQPEPWDIIHGHSSKGGAMARLAGVFSGAARIYTPHALVTLDPGLGTAKRVMYRTIEWALAMMSDGIICVSQAERAHAASLGIPERKLTVIENCLKPLPAADRVGARKEMGLEEDDVCIGCVGRLAPQKNITRLLTAFSRIQPRLPDAKLVIVGDGQDADILREQARNLSIEDSVIWTGHADGPALMAGFDIFALSSDYEAFPYVFLEAAARGLPIVSTRVGGAEDVVKDGINGYVVDDESALGDRLGELVCDAGKRAAMGQAALKRSLDFNIDRMVTETLEYYRQSIV